MSKLKKIFQAFLIFPTLLREMLELVQKIRVSLPKDPRVLFRCTSNTLYIVQDRIECNMELTAVKKKRKKKKKERKKEIGHI